VRIGSGNEVIEYLRTHKTVPINIRPVGELKESHDVINPRATILLVFLTFSKRLAHVLLVDSAHGPTVPYPVESLDYDDRYIANDPHFADRRR
jgi:hypothetical protein